MELVSIGKFAKMVGVTTTTLRRMHQSGDFIPYHITKGGTRYYSMEQLKEFSNAPETEKLVVGYCRVSTPAQKNDLQMQVENVKSYMYAKGYKFEIITDVGSGINYKKKGLRQLVNKINNHEVSQNRVIQFLHKKLTNIRNNYLHQTTAEIVKTKPSRIVMEDLNVKGIMKNKHLSKAIAQQKIYEFKRQIKYKAEMYGIEVVEADRYYASSKTCSYCGHIKKDLKLSDRIYICPNCGAKLNRDLNAAINLANYKTA